MFKILLLAIACLLLQGIIVTSMAQDTTPGDSAGLPLPPGTEVLETGVLKNVSGYRGGILGAEVISVVKAENDQSELIEVNIPVDLEFQQVDRVSVFSSTGQRIKPDKPLEIVLDREKNQVEIMMSLPRKPRVGFVIKLIDLPDE